ncbi:MAG TPA: hypothetical protein VIY86_02430, partial [Pirellulaceae bacterium]
SPPGARGGPGGPAASGSLSSFGASLAATRGENWALPNSADGSIGMARPVRVRCERGQLILLPERGTSEVPQAFPFQTSLESAVPAFVDALWKRIDAWGVAGPAAYWKPILKVEAAPDCQTLLEELTALLDRSGLIIETTPAPH